MTFDEWWDDNRFNDFYTEEDIANEAWNAAQQRTAEACAQVCTRQSGWAGYMYAQQIRNGNWREYL